MEFFPGDTEESTEDLPGRKKSKVKSLRTRIFGRMKRAHEEGNTKLSQSASDITAGKGLGSEEDLVCSQGMLGSRALSHDSIFLADQVLSDAEPARVLSQENVHSKIKSLQIKLQQQKLHLGPPPLVLPIKRPEDLSSRSEEDGLPHSSPKISEGGATTQGAFSKAISQPSSHPLSPIPKPAPIRSVPPIPSLSSPRSALSTSPPTNVALPLDFSSVAQFTPCLDTSAARHRMSVKPRNQRASTKGKRLTVDSRPQLDAINNTDHPVSEKEEEQGLTAHEEMTHLRSHITQILEPGQGGVNIPTTKTAYITSEFSKAQAISLSPTQQDHPGRATSVASQLLGVKSHKPVDVMSSQQPHSSIIQTYLNEKREASGDLQALSQDKRDTLGKAGASLASVVAFRSSSVHQQTDRQTEATEGIKTPGSGSFHLSITTSKGQDGERPRSRSFLGVMEQAGARLKTGEGTEVKSLPSNVSQRGKELQVDRQEEDKPRDLQPRGGPTSLGVVGTPREEVTLHKGPVMEQAGARLKTGEGTEVKSLPSNVSQRGKELQVDRQEEDKPRDLQPRGGPTSLGVVGTPREEVTLHKGPVMEQAGARLKTGEGTEVKSLPSNVSQRGKELQVDRQEEDKPRDLQPRGGPTSLGVVGTPREEVTLHKGPVFPWDRRESLKKGGPVTPSKEATMDTGALEGKAVEDSQEVVEEAVEAKEIQEEAGKTAFGVKLRSTSLSLKFRSDVGTANSEAKVKQHSAEMGSLTPPLAPYNPPSTSVLSEEKCDKRKREEIGDNASYTSKKLPTNAPCTSTTSGYLRQTGGIPTQSGFSSLPVKHNPPAANDPHIIPAPSAEAQTISSNLKEVEIGLQEPQSAPQMVSSEVSWMSLAMEKTRSLQQLITSRLPRDFTSIQTAARPQTQVQPTNQGQTVTQSHLQKVTQSETQIQTQTVKQQQSSPQLQAAVQPSTGATTPSLTMVPQLFKQANDLPLQPNTTQPVTQSGLNSVSHPAVQANIWTTQSPLQLSTPAPTSAPLPVLGRGDRAAALQGKEEPSLSERRMLWTGSVGERAAVLEKRTEWTTPSGNKVELKKTQTETPAESPALPNTTPSNKDRKPEGRQRVKFAESSPTTVPGRLADREDKWLRKNMPPSSSPSSSPTTSSPLQSMSDSGQPSWMELAKRKSMAWNDKTMD